MKKVTLFVLILVVLFTSIGLSYYTLGSSEVLPSLGSPYYKTPNYYSYGYPSYSYLRPYYGYGYGYLSYPSIQATYVPTIRYSTRINYHYSYPTYAPYYPFRYSYAYGAFNPYYTYPYGW
jgi:hypothetical protein